MPTICQALCLPIICESLKSYNNSTNLLSHNVRHQLFFPLGFSLLKFSLVYTTDKVNAPGEKLSGPKSFGDGEITPSQF